MLSSKYLRILDTYLEWEFVTTPAKGTFQELGRKMPVIEAREGGLSAGEALCRWESTGQSAFIRPDDIGLLHRYLKGKSQRDWWTREIGWWNNHAAYIPEEFLGHLGPLPFIELFGRSPITRLVRYYFDNGYKLWEFQLDGAMLRFTSQWSMSYYERDDRHSALSNARRMVFVKWIDPLIYRVKRKFRLAHP